MGVSTYQLYNVTLSIVRDTLAISVMDAAMGRMDRLRKISVKLDNL